MKKVVLAILILAALRGVAVAASDHSIGAAVTWLALPFAPWVLGPGPLRGTLTSMGAVLAGKILIGASVGLALLHFASFERYRDHIGQAYIPGYSVSYGVDYDDYGRPHRDSTVHTDSLFARFLLWAGEGAFLVAAIGLPLLTWKSSEKYLFDPATMPESSCDD